VHYVCAATVDDLLRGEHLDRSEWHGGGIEVVAGAGELLACLDEAILQSCLGDTIRVDIPPEQGFGRRGVPGYVSPDSFLYFDIEISKPSDRKDASKGVSR
jgi:FKBP-type peptidyl-prolyl cis-trans isomerase